MNIYFLIFNCILQLLYIRLLLNTKGLKGSFKYIQQSIKSCIWTLRYECNRQSTDIGHSHASQNYEKMGTEFIF